MSRLGKNPIKIPAGVTVTKTGDNVVVTGPKGNLKRDFLPIIDIKIDNGQISLSPKKEDKKSSAFWGTYASHLINMIEGVQKPFEKKLIVEGVGYKWSMSGSNIDLAIGFSHPVKIPVPEGLIVSVEKNQMMVSGIDKELVGSFSAKIRSLKKPEPYKGKGIRYEGEFVRRKQGKKSA